MILRPTNNIWLVFDARPVPSERQRAVIATNVVQGFAMQDVEEWICCRRETQRSQIRTLTHTTEYD